jgi:hypothetical protein
VSFSASTSSSILPICTFLHHHVYFSESLSVLPTFADDFIIFATISGDFAVSKVEPLYFPSTLCISHSHRVYFLCLLTILTIVYCPKLNVSTSLYYWYVLLFY